MNADQPTLNRGHEAETIDLAVRTACEALPARMGWVGAERALAGHRQRAVDAEHARAREVHPLHARAYARREEERLALGTRVQIGLDLENQNPEDSHPDPPSPRWWPLRQQRQQAITRRAEDAHQRARQQHQRQGRERA